LGYAVVVFLLAPALFPQTDPLELVRQGRRLSNQGKQDEALALYRQALQASPDLVEAHVAAGVALDLNGQYAEARKHLAKAIEAAKPENRNQALRTMAMSYAFENNCKEAAKYESQLYESYLAAKDFYNAGEMADELARVCIESGDLDEAYKWYQTGHDAGLREPGLKPDRKDLWDFRWEHAQARIAARRGKADEAQKHVAAAKAILDKGTNPDQAQFFPYLTGYVALYTGDTKTAIAELQKASQRDPFILVLLGQAYEKSGEKAQAMECYRKALASNAHNPPNALARPIARKKIG
jgi:tetratricopeptide (TPR) repeat protein